MDMFDFLEKLVVCSMQSCFTFQFSESISVMDMDTI